MKTMNRLFGVTLVATAALALAAPAYASDYKFTTKAPQDYYGSTSYEEVYGSQYNYGGRNVVDYDVPELEYGIQSTTMTGVMERTILPGLQQVVATADGSGGYGVGVGNGGPITELIEVNGSGNSGTVSPVIPSTPQITAPNIPAYTSVTRTSCKRRWSRRRRSLKAPLWRCGSCVSGTAPAPGVTGPGPSSHPWRSPVR